MKRRATFFSICVALIVILASSIAYGYYARLYKGWQQQINIGEVMLKLNGQFVDTYSSYDHNFSIGENYDLELELESLSSVPVKYTVALDLERMSDGGSGNLLNLAPAIEVYEYKDGEYVFVSMLDRFVETDLEGHLGAKEVFTYRYKLVYSLGAGSFYEGAGFVLDVKASSYVETELSSLPYVYASNSIALRQIESTGSAAGKTIKLLSDITLPENIMAQYIFEEKIGLDLNGHTLTLNKSSIRIEYDASSEGQSDEWCQLGIYDSSIDKTGQIIATTGHISIESPNDAMKIDDGIVGAQYIIVPEYSVEAFALRARENIDRLSAKRIGRAKDVSNAYIDTYVDVFEDLKYYFDNEAGAGNAKITADMGASEIAGGFLTLEGVVPEKIGMYKIVQWPENTSILYQVFVISYGGAPSGHYAAGYFALQGKSFFSFAETLLENVPSYVAGDIFLPVYDDFYKAYMTWIVDDNRLLGDNGKHLPQGREGFESYADLATGISVIVNFDGEVAAVKKRVEPIRVQIADARHRSDSVFEEENIFLIEIGDSYRLKFLPYDMYNDGTALESFDALKKAALKSVEITFKDNLAYGATGSDNEDSYLNLSPVRSDSGHMYISVNLEYKSQLDVEAKYIIVEYKFTFFRDYEDFTFDADFHPIDGFRNITITRLPLVEQGNSGIFDRTFVIDFSDCYTSGYNGTPHTTDYTFQKLVTVVGSNQEQYAVDPTQELQTEFNPYYNEIGTYHDFDVKNYLLSGQDVIYVVPEPFDEYVSFTDDRTEGVWRTYFHIEKSRVPQYVTEVTVLAFIGQNIYNTESTYYKLENGEFIEMSSFEAFNYFDRNEGVLYVRYDIFFCVTGILHNTAEDIPDTGLYRGLLEAAENLSGPNIHKDLWLTIHEAQALTEFIYPERGIRDLKGMEFFTSITKLDLSNNLSTAPTANIIVDVMPLEPLVKITSLKLGHNRISNISAFTMMEELSTLWINNNTITDLTPIRYLSQIKDLDISYNDLLYSFDGLQDMTGIEKLNVSNGNSTFTWPTNRYVLALLCVNIEDLGSAAPTILPSGASPTAMQKVAARVLKELIVVRETYTTLNLPSTYHYKDANIDKVYKLKWYSSVFDSGVIQIYEEDGVSKYRIFSPIVDTFVNISVEIIDQETSERYMCEREFYINILTKDYESEELYVWTGTEYMLASRAVPDPVLRSLLYYEFNDPARDDANITINDTVGQLLGKWVIDQTEVSKLVPELRNWSNRRISNLEGLRYFGGLSALNLQGNNFTDISELSYLTKRGSFTGLQYLYLDGQRFNFNQLVMDEEAVGANGVQGVYYDGTTRGLVNCLRELHVYGSFGLDEDDILLALYHVFRQNNSTPVYSVGGVNRTAGIYKDIDPASQVDYQSVKWDPFSEQVALKARSIETTHVLYDIDQTIYLTRDGKPIATAAEMDALSGNIYYEWYFYDDEERKEFPLFFYFVSALANVGQTSGTPASNYISSSLNTQANPSRTTGNVNTYPTISYGTSRLVSDYRAFYMSATLRCANQNANLSGHLVTGYLDSTIYFEFIMEPNDKIVINDYIDLDEDEVGGNIAPKQVTFFSAFPGRAVREGVVEAINAGTYLAGSTGLPFNVAYIRTKYNELDGKYHLSVSDFSNININNRIGGIANVANYDSDTSSFGPLNSVVADWLMYTEVSYLNGTYATYPIFRVDYGSYLEATSYQLQNPLKGLELLPSTTRIYLPFEAPVGDGRHLIHIKNMYISLAAVDFTTLDGDAIHKSNKYYNSADYAGKGITASGLYNMETLVMYRCLSFKFATYEAIYNTEGRLVGAYNIDSSLRFLPNLINLVLPAASASIAAESYVRDFVGLITYTDRKYNPYYSGLNREIGAIANQLETINLSYQKASASAITEEYLDGIWFASATQDILYTPFTDEGELISVSRILRNKNNPDTVGTGVNLLTAEYFQPGANVTGSPAVEVQHPDDKSYIVKASHTAASLATAMLQEMDEYAALVDDYGLQIATSSVGSDMEEWTWQNHFDSDGTLSSGGYIRLPAYVMTFQGFNDDKKEANGDATTDKTTTERKFPIIWTMPAVSILSQVGTIGDPAAFDRYHVYKATASTYDRYVIIKGSIMVSSLGRYREISYPILIKGSSSGTAPSGGYSYGRIEDLSLRYMIHLRLGANATTYITAQNISSGTMADALDLPIDASTGYTSSTVAPDAAYLVAIRAQEIDYSGTSNSNIFRYGYYGYRVSTATQYIFSLVGLELFTNLTSLNLSGHMITDISPLATLTNLTSLILTNNRITRVDALSEMNMLKNVDLSYNYLETTTLPNGKSVFEKSFDTLCTTVVGSTLGILNLSYNPNLGPESLASLVVRDGGGNIIGGMKGMGTAGTAGQLTVNLYGTDCLNKIETVSALRDFLKGNELTGAVNTQRLHVYIASTANDTYYTARDNRIKLLDFVLNEAETSLEKYKIGEERGKFQTALGSGAMIVAPAGLTFSPSVTIPDPFISPTGTTLAESYEGTLRTKLRVAYTANVVVLYDVKIMYSGENRSDFPLTFNGPQGVKQYNVYDDGTGQPFFDPAIVGYLATFGQQTNLSSSLTAIQIIGTDFAKDWGWQSTKGFNYFTNLKDITLYNAANGTNAFWGSVVCNPIKELIDLPSGLTTLRVCSRVTTTAQNVRSIAGLASLTTLDLSTIGGIDYTEKVVGDRSIGDYIVERRSAVSTSFVVRVNNDFTAIRSNPDGSVNYAATLAMPAALEFNNISNFTFAGKTSVYGANPNTATMSTSVATSAVYTYIHPLYNVAAAGFSTFGRAKFYLGINLAQRLQADYSVLFGLSVATSYGAYLHSYHFYYGTTAYYYRTYISRYTSANSTYDTTGEFMNSILNFKPMNQTNRSTVRDPLPEKYKFYNTTNNGYTKYLTFAGDYANTVNYAAAPSNFYVDHDRPVYFPQYVYFYGRKIELGYTITRYTSSSVNSVTTENDNLYDEGVIDFSKELLHRITLSYSVFIEEKGDTSIYDGTEYTFHGNYGYFSEIDSVDVSGLTQTEYIWGEAFNPAGIKVVGKFIRVSPLLSGLSGYTGYGDYGELIRDMPSNSLSYDYSFNRLGTNLTVDIYIRNNDMDEFGDRMALKKYGEIYDITVRTNRDPNTAMILDQNDVKATVAGDYYVQLESGGALERAEPYFDSPAFMEYLYTNTTLNANNEVQSTSNSGYYYAEYDETAGKDYYHFVEGSVKNVGKTGYYIKSGAAFSGWERVYRVGKISDMDGVTGLFIFDTERGIGVSIPSPVSGYYKRVGDNYVPLSVAEEADVVRVEYISSYTVLSYSEIMSVTTMTVDSRYNIYTQTAYFSMHGSYIRGIELFKNLKDLTLYGIPGDISPLASLKLRSFSHRAITYSSSIGVQPSFEIKDWSPLYNSADTLTSLSYQYSYSTNHPNYRYGVEDLAFITYFPELTDLWLNYYVGFNYTSAFKQILIWMLESSKINNFYFNTTAISQSTAVIYNGQLNYQYIAYVNSTVPNFTSDYFKAYDTYAWFEPNHPSIVRYYPYETSGLAENAYELRLTSAADFSNNGNTVVAYLPSTIWISGDFYEITYKSLSNNITIDTARTNGNMYKITVTDRTMNLLGRAYILLRITINGIVYDKIMNINMINIEDAPPAGAGIAPSPAAQTVYYVREEDGYAVV